MGGGRAPTGRNLGVADSSVTIIGPETSKEPLTESMMYAGVVSTFRLGKDSLVVVDRFLVRSCFDEGASGGQFHHVRIEVDSVP